MKKPIKLAVVDDQLLFREGLLSLIKENEELEVIIEASNGKELLEKIKTKRPDIILLDVEMPEMDGIETTKCLKAKYPDIKVLILSMYNDEEIIVDLIEKGARGFLLKNYSSETVVDAIYSVTETGYYFNDRVSKAMVKGLVKNKKILSGFNRVQLSEREIEIVKLICNELTNKEIAEKLFISVRTVDGHREKILQKTKAKNVAGIVRYAYEHHLMD